jgi:hypothetical protein
MKRNEFSLEFGMDVVSVNDQINTGVYTTSLRLLYLSNYSMAQKSACTSWVEMIQGNTNICVCTALFRL